MLLSIKNVTTGYEKAQVLKDITLNVEAKEIVALVGANGAGKTTTLQCISGVIKPWVGSVSLGERDLAPFAPYQIVAMGISYCPEGRDVFANLSVYENLRIGAYLIRDAREFRDRLDRVYSLFPRLQQRLNQLSGSLSGGEQQMLAIARALMTNPDLLLLDEPSLGLAPILVESIYNTIQEINAAGKAILLVEQNVGLALEVSSRGYVLEKGEIRLSGPSPELQDSDYVKASYLGIA
jgi:branched-chain amino acid transport system ATP-binding protein